MSINVKCPNCGNINSVSGKYCLECGKLIQLAVMEPLQDRISINQMVWILIGGYSIYFIVRYFIRLDFSIVVLISAFASFIMSRRLLKIANKQNFKDFFPHWKEFFIFTGTIILALEILIILISSKLSKDDILITKIIPISFEFIQGYSFGIITPIFFNFYTKKRNLKI